MHFENVQMFECSSENFPIFISWSKLHFMGFQAFSHHRQSPWLLIRDKTTKGGKKGEKEGICRRKFSTRWDISACRNEIERRFASRNGRFSVCCSRFTFLCRCMTEFIRRWKSVSAKSPALLRSLVVCRSEISWTRKYYYAKQFLLFAFLFTFMAHIWLTNQTNEIRKFMNFVI